MLRYIRTILVILFILALIGAAALFLYNYTHEDVSPPAFRMDSDLVEVSVSDPDSALLQGLSAYDNVDGDLSAQIRIKDISTLINETDVTVTYIVFDAASNYATCTRTARYTDYKPPRFGLTRPMIFKPKFRIMEKTSLIKALLQHASAFPQLASSSPASQTRLRFC